MNLKTAALALLPFAYLTLAARGQPTAGQILWTNNLGGLITSSPALEPDGAVYVAANSSLYAITNSGSVASNKWSVPASLAGSPAIGPDGTVYFGEGRSSVNIKLRALNSTDGSERWRFLITSQAQLSFRSTPAIGSDNTIYFVAGGRLYSVQSGVEKWETLIDDQSLGTSLSPVIGPDGTIYVGASFSGTLFAFAPDGSNKWSVGLSSNGAESPAISRNGTIYYAAGALYAFNRDGAQVWASGFNTGLASPISIASDGSIYVAQLGRHLYAFTSAGQALWDKLGAPQYFSAYTAPAVDAGGTLYYCVSNSVWALTPKGDVQWAITSPDTPPQNTDLANSSPVIGGDGTVYAAVGSILYAIASGTNSAAPSSWPMYQQNAKHTAKIERPTLGQPQKRADFNFEFQLYPQQLGSEYGIEVSTNFATWTSLTSIVAATLPTSVVDLTATNADFRFYRAVTLP
jgi:outer membrane protein assembly factor BamB